AEVYDSNPDVEGLLLLKHGHFAFGPDAKSSYDLIVSHTNEVADFLKMQETTSLQVRLPAQAPDGLARLRGALAPGDRDAPMPVLALRNGPDVMAFFDRNDAAELATRGVASPDHVIRTKAKPLVLSKDDLASQEAITAKIDAFKADYEAYFARQNARVGNDRTVLKPTPNLVWAEGFGLIGVGSSDKAAHIAADLG
ncbi:unnamed protein product, partial [Ectocarpus sp. 12 AP-2014]